MTREGSAFAPFTPRDVDPLPLHKVSRQSDTRFLIVQRAHRKAGIEKAQKAVKGTFVPAVRGSRQKNEMSLLALGQTPEKFKPLLPSLVRTYACVGLIDNDGLGARTR